jgi:hypothetical protein
VGTAGGWLPEGNLTTLVAVWRGAVAGTGGLPALKELAEELDAVLLDGEVRAESLLKP